MDDTCPVAAKGGFISLELRYAEDKPELKQTDEERSWDHSKAFKQEAEKTSFKLHLGELHGLQEGCLYRAQIRCQIR